MLCKKEGSLIEFKDKLFKNHESLSCSLLLSHLMLSKRRSLSSEPIHMNRVGGYRLDSVDESRVFMTIEDRRSGAIGKLNIEQDKSWSLASYSYY